MKIATLDDIQEIKEMSIEFMELSGYRKLSDDNYIEAVIEDILKSLPNEKIIILKPGIGFIAGIATPFIFGPHLLASEIAWWIKPQHRKGKHGLELIKAFEYWAKEKAGCSLISMTSLDDKVGSIYEKKGYKLYERAYMKELN